MESNKDRTTAIVLALFLGGLGVHKFYIGKTGQGLVFLLFCWTFIPALLGLIDAVRYLGMSDAEFQQNAVTNDSGAKANGVSAVQRSEPKTVQRSEPKMVKKFRDTRLGGSEEIIDFMPAHVGELMGSGDDKQINGTLILTNQRLVFLGKRMFSERFEQITLDQIKSLSTESGIVFSAIKVNRFKFTSQNKQLCQRFSTSYKNNASNRNPQARQHRNHSSRANPRWINSPS